jgi:DNA processing protein
VRTLLGGAERIIRSDNPEWPEFLQELSPHPPAKRLFVRGLPIEPMQSAVAVVGTRNPTTSGLEAAWGIAGGLAEAGIVVISGLAVGIDAVAHQAALAAGGRTIAVLGCGLDVDYPSQNHALRHRIAAEGTLISEYPDGTRPQRRHFPRRNRIIAGLSVAVVVVEGAATSGALVTARLALDANRDVYAVPGSTRNPMAAGPNELIRTGRAALVTEVKHIFDDLAPRIVSTESLVVSGATEPAETPVSSLLRQGLSDAERVVLLSLDDVPVSVDRLTMMLKLKPGKVAVSLSRLEIRGLAFKSRGGYALTSSGVRARSGAHRRPLGKSDIQ